jgi:hypothetical protein
MSNTIGCPFCPKLLKEASLHEHVRRHRIRTHEGRAPLRPHLVAAYLASSNRIDCANKNCTQFVSFQVRNNGPVRTCKSCLRALRPPPGLAPSSPPSANTRSHRSSSSKDQRWLIGTVHFLKSTHTCQSRTFKEKCTNKEKSIPVSSFSMERWLKKDVTPLLSQPSLSSGDQRSSSNRSAAAGARDLVRAEQTLQYSPPFSSPPRRPRPRPPLFCFSAANRSFVPAFVDIQQ